MSYSVAITRVPLTALGVRTRDGKLIGGDVTANVVDGRLNSVTVKPFSGGKAVNVKGTKVERLSLPSQNSRLVFASYTR